MFLLFPFLLLSALEAGSPLTPFSLPILMSLRHHGRAWLAFYGQSIALFAACWLIGLVLWTVLPALALLPIGVVLASTLMIYFRLLGRLAWHCSWLPEEEDDEVEPASGLPTDDEDHIGRLE